ncbi:MAG: ABC transporter substrate-binding protein [Lachnospiraceae bacterium]|nr:ABC transporter substrate-binding protein [Lachnospiraceae bacterium]
MKIKVKTLLSQILIIVLLLTGCGRPDSPAAAGTRSNDTSKKDDKGYITVGFSQVGAESDWRNINTESMKDSLCAENGYDLIYDDGQQKQQNQITAIRTFIQKEVDYIVLAPVIEDGWNTVLTEASDAGIPVILVDRMVNVSDPDLFTCWVGSDFELEGRKVCEWLNAFCKANRISGGEINIVNIMGTEGASAEIGRSRTLREAVRQYGWNLLDERSGEFTQAKGREVMSQFLKQYNNINVVYCENDNEAFGAIDAIEASGRTVGTDIKHGEIMVLAFDGSSDQAVEAVRSGRISCIGECNPLHGPRVEKIIRNLQNGITPDKYEYVDEDIFSAEPCVKSITVKGETYTVKLP